MENRKDIHMDLSSIESINNLDTARMSLRWALERLHALEKAKEELTAKADKELAAREKTEGIIWSPRYALLPQKLQAIYGGWKDFRLWWLIFVATCLSIYGFFLWFRFQHPENP